MKHLKYIIYLNPARYRLVLGFALCTLNFALFPRPAFAALSAVKDTITTSRPSASTPLQDTINAGVTQATIYDNGSRFIASDSARLLGTTQETVVISSMSAANTPVSNQRILYFAGVSGQYHTAGSVIMTPVTSTHVISFVTTALPASGHVIITLPVGNTSDQSSPSATGFSFNGLVAGNISVSGISVSTCAPTASLGKVDCTLSSSFGGGEVSVTLGTTTPALINPTKTAAAGVADTWTVTVKTTDNNSVTLDQVNSRIGTVDSVEVYANVDPNISITIVGRTNGLAINTGNTTGCTNTELTNTGIDSSATVVSLGTLNSGMVNISAQLITIATNASGGYVLTATSSGHLIDPGTGYWIADVQGTPTGIGSPAPAFFTAGVAAFGIHPCGLDVNTTTWGSGTTGGGAGAKYANASPAYYYTLASRSSGPVDNSITAGMGLTSIEYASTISGVVPAGTYRTALTYVATPTF